MATDRLPNSTQMADAVSALQIIANKSQTPYNASNKLPTDYADDTNQTHKFATQAQLEQIALNETNISTDEAALVELVDSGAKNLLQNTAETQTITGVTFTVNRDGTITANGTATANTSIAIYANDEKVLNKSWICSGCPENGSNTSYRCFVQKLSGGTYVTVATMTGGGVEFTLDTAQYRYLITIYSGYRADNLVFEPMICTVPAWKISQAYQPHRPSYQELYERVVALEQANQ